MHDDTHAHLADGCRVLHQDDDDLPPLEALSPEDLSTSLTNHALHGAQADQKAACNGTRLEFASSMVLSPGWGAVIVTGDASTETGEHINGTRPHTNGHGEPDVGSRPAGHSSDQTEDVSSSWESFFTALRDTRLSQADIVEEDQQATVARRD